MMKRQLTKVKLTPPSSLLSLTFDILNLKFSDVYLVGEIVSELV